MSPATLIRPKFVALDSSHLGDVARDTFSSDPARREKAATFERAFENTGSVLLLSWHHLQELLSHENEETIRQRFEYVVSKPLVASLKSLTDDRAVGTIIDVQAMETAAAFKDASLPLRGVRDAAATGMFTLGSGRDLARPFIEASSPLSEALTHQGHRDREIVAISRSDFAGVGHIKIVDLLNQAARSPDESTQRLGELNARLRKDIQKRGDKRIRSPAQTSQTFIEDVARMGRDLARGPNPALQILLAVGLDLSDIGPQTTVDDVGRLSVFRRKLELVNQVLELPWPDLKERVTHNRLPSTAIQAAVEKFRPETSEWKGSDLTDAYLVCLSAYAHVTFVDKRTHEALRQARPKLPELATILKRVEKTGDYGTIAEMLVSG